MSKISENFCKALDLLGLRQIDISKKYDIPRQTVNIFMTDQKTITDKLIEVCEKENINLNFIATGKGNIIIKENEKTNFKEELHKMIDEIKEEKAEIYYHLIKAEILKEKLW